MNAKIIATILWILCIVCCGIFLLAASGKFSFAGNMHDNFLRWGYPSFFLIVVGVCEGIGGLLLLVPALRTYGILLLVLVMGGAVVTHLLNREELGVPIFPLAIVIGLLLIYFLHRKRELKAQ